MRKPRVREHTDENIPVWQTRVFGLLLGGPQTVVNLKLNQTHSVFKEQP